METTSFNYTLLLIVVVAILGLLARRRKKDRCLRNFEDSPVTIEKIDGTLFTKGILNVKTTGLILNFPKIIYTTNKLRISSTLIYKYEFEFIQAIIRPYSELSLQGKKKRAHLLRKSSRPNLIRKSIRLVRNVFNLLKDSFLEIMNISVSYLTTKRATGLMAHDKYLKDINANLIESVGLSHEPLLEPYIGHKIVFELLKKDKKIKLQGILQDYTKEFIQVSNVMYHIAGKENPELVDMIIPQKLIVVRHYSKKIPYQFPFLKEIKSFSHQIAKIERNKN